MENISLTTEEIKKFKDETDRLKKIRIELELWSRYYYTYSFEFFWKTLGIEFVRNYITLNTPLECFEKAFNEPYDSRTTFYYNRGLRLIEQKRVAYELLKDKKYQIIDTIAPLKESKTELLDNPNAIILRGNISVMEIDNIKYVYNKDSKKIIFGTPRKVKVLDKWCGNANSIGYFEFELI